MLPAWCRWRWFGLREVRQAFSQSVLSLLVGLREELGSNPGVFRDPGVRD